MSMLLEAASYLPGVEEPEKEQSLKEMLTWTGITLLLYFVLGSITIYGPTDATAVQQAINQLQTFQTILGAQIGSIITLGIGPIVTASIVLQMMVGSELLPWNTNTEEGQQKFQATQKLLAWGLSIVQGFGYVLSGTFGNISDPFLIFLIGGQIALGGIMIILMDDLIQKWGFGSGTGLFIAAGVSRSIFVQIFSPLTRSADPQLYWQVGGQPTGALFSFAAGGGLTDLIPVLATAIVFAVVVYLQSMRVEIPLTFGNVRGFGQKWPLKFLYTSVMPVILIAALITNIQIMGTALSGANGCSALGCFADGQADSGLVFLLQAPTQTITNLFSSGFSALAPGSILHIIFYLAIYAIGSTIFSIFWMKTSGQDADSVADQIQATGMKVPGFRKDKRVIKKVLNRYIPGLTVLSGFIIGTIAALANMTQAAGGGTGILLTVMILQRLYEQLAQKHMEELHPALKDFMGSA